MLSRVVWRRRIKGLGLYRIASPFLTRMAQALIPQAIRQKRYGYARLSCRNRLKISVFFRISMLHEIRWLQLQKSNQINQALNLARVLKLFR